MNQLVLILDFQGVISNGGIDVISRHRIYAKKLQEVSNRSLTLRIVTTNETNLLNMEGEELFLRLGRRNRSYVGNILELRKYILSNGNIGLIVAGDVFKSGLQAMLSQMFFKKKLPIQFQVHADIGAKGWASFSYANRLKYLMGTIVLRNAKYVRAVSKRQAINLQKLTKKTAEIQIVPVPLNIPRGFKYKPKNDSQFKVGVLGRIQKDRGITLFDQFVRELGKDNQKVKFVIAGNGPDDSIMMEIQNQLSSLTEFQNMGYLSSEELVSFWTEADCLLSLAPFESYGRSIREAVCLGIRVISMPTAGALDLLDEVGPNWVSLWSPGQEPNAGELIRRFKTFANGSEAPPNLGLIGSEIEMLIQSWRDCI